jgi:hypothetical protein
MPADMFDGAVPRTLFAAAIAICWRGSFSMQANLQPERFWIRQTIMPIPGGNHTFGSCESALAQLTSSLLALHPIFSVDYGASIQPSKLAFLHSRNKLSLLG